MKEMGAWECTFQDNRFHRLRILVSLVYTLPVLKRLPKYCLQRHQGCPGAVFRRAAASFSRQGLKVKMFSQRYFLYVAEHPFCRFQLYIRAQTPLPHIRIPQRRHHALVPIASLLFPPLLSWRAPRNLLFPATGEPAPDAISPARVVGSAPWP